MNERIASLKKQLLIIEESIANAKDIISKRRKQKKLLEKLIQLEESGQKDLLDES